MSMGAALNAAREVVAIEILCGCQAIDLLAPLTWVALARAIWCDPVCRRLKTIARRLPISSRSLNSPR
jgi:histidine ammonia-lyase